MRQANLLVTATGQVNIGDCEMIEAGQRVNIFAGDSVATATLDIALNGTSVGRGLADIEPGTDRLEIPGNLYTSFKAKVPGQMIVTAGGTVAGLRVKILILNPDEPNPY